MLIVVSGDGERYLPAAECGVPSLRVALEHWESLAPQLNALAARLEDPLQGIRFSTERFLAPLPRTWALLDGSAFLEHVVLARKARGAELPQDLSTIPLMYQGASDNLLGPNDDLPLQDQSWGMDFELELCVVTDHVPSGPSESQAAAHIKLLLLMNDVSLRGLIPREIATGFGFLHGKPPSAFAPFAVTPDELGDAWRDGRAFLTPEVRLNGSRFGAPHSGEMHFSFHQLIAHAARTRPLSAGTIIGSGTISNADPSVGEGCIVERRMREQLQSGTPQTPYLKAGDTIEMHAHHNHRSLFGNLKQQVIPGKAP